jgi:hypothetical protein
LDVVQLVRRHLSIYLVYSESFPALFLSVPLLSILLDLAGAVAGSEPYPFNKKFKANKTDISRARDWLAQYVPPCDLIGTVASATRGEAELRTIAVASGQRIASDPKKVTLLIKVQAQVRVFLARRLFARLLRDRYFREKTARELLETEQTYRRGLDVLSTFYTKRLKTAKDASGRLLVSAEEHTVLFGGLLGLAEVSQDFVERLERRIGNWRSSSVIGDVFLKVAGSLKLYSVYVKSFADADELLKRKLRASSEFEQYLAQCQRDSGLSLDLVSLLITPVQRLPRYELLLRELLNRTDGAHADAEPLRRALHEVSSVARYVNDRQRDADSQRALLDAQKRILGRPRDFVQPHRALINEGDVLMGAKKDPRRLFLMSDLLVVTRRLSRLERLKEENATAVRYVDSLSMDTVRLRPLHATSLELVGVSRFDVSETPDAPAAAAPTKEKTMVMWFATEGEMSTWLHRFDDIQRSAAVAMLPAFPATAAVRRRPQGAAQAVRGGRVCHHAANLQRGGVQGGEEPVHAARRAGGAGGHCHAQASHRVGLGRRVRHGHGNFQSVQNDAAARVVGRRRHERHVVRLVGRADRRQLVASAAVAAARRVAELQSTRVAAPPPTARRQSRAVAVAARQRPSPRQAAQPRGVAGARHRARRLAAPSRHANRRAVRGRLVVARPAAHQQRVARPLVAPPPQSHWRTDGRVAAERRNGGRNCGRARLAGAARRERRRLGLGAGGALDVAAQLGVGRIVGLAPRNRQWQRRRRIARDIVGHGVAGRVGALARRRQAQPTTHVAGGGAGSRAPQHRSRRGRRSRQRQGRGHRISRRLLR